MLRDSRHNFRHQCTYHVEHHFSPGAVSDADFNGNRLDPVALELFAPILIVFPTTKDTRDVIAAAAR
jgi:hypothetical protein